jgi:hypothetical protein
MEGTCREAGKPLPFEPTSSGILLVTRSTDVPVAVTVWRQGQFANTPLRDSQL